MPFQETAVKQITQEALNSTGSFARGDVAARLTPLTDYNPGVEAALTAQVRDLTKQVRQAKKTATVKRAVSCGWEKADPTRTSCVSCCVSACLQVDGLTRENAQGREREMKMEHAFNTLKNDSSKKISEVRDKRQEARKGALAFSPSSLSRPSGLVCGAVLCAASRYHRDDEVS